MALARPRIHDQCTCDVTIATSEIAAGGEVSLTISAACPEGCDLSGVPVAVTDRNGIELASGVLASSGQEEAGYVATLAFAAPLATGEQAFEARLVEKPKRRVIHRAPPAAVSLTVLPHVTHLNVWQVPSATVAGEPVRFRVGVRCAAGCDLHGRQVTVYDSAGDAVATASLGGEVWPGTSALYHAEATAAAPGEPGAHQWQVTLPADESGVPHAAGSAQMTLNVVPGPDFEVVIETVDRAAKTPVTDARIVMHPYRAVSDASGIARLKVARGDYTMFVSGRRYLPMRTSVSVSGNINTRAELEREPPPPNPDENYY